MKAVRGWRCRCVDVATSTLFSSFVLLLMVFFLTLGCCVPMPLGCWSCLGLSSSPLLRPLSFYFIYICQLQCCHTQVPCCLPFLLGAAPGGDGLVHFHVFLGRHYKCSKVLLELGQIVEFLIAVFFLLFWWYRGLNTGPSTC
jgi:hypothetical protein